MVEINELNFVENDNTYSLPAVDKLFKNFYIRRPLNYDLEIDSKRIVNTGTGYLPEAIEDEFLIEHHDVRLKVLIYVRKVITKVIKTLQFSPLCSRIFLMVKVMKMLFSVKNHS